MGRMKGFLCAFCLGRHQEGAEGDQSFNQGVDVSHLATPHTSFQHQAQRVSSNSTPIEAQISDNNNNNNDEENNNYSSQYSRQEPLLDPSSSAAQAQRISPQPPSISRDSPLISQPNDVNNLNIRSSNSPSQSRPADLYEHQHLVNNNSAQRRNDDLIEHHQPPDLHHLNQQQAHQQILPVSHETSTRLSYDIISVREPLAKILAERQLLHQAQQQQKQMFGDHEYIEVYGERGSSCFYEEIAGSTTSSATYDQIGNSSNHNYQALINAYAITNRLNEYPELNNDNAHHNDTNRDVLNNDVTENIYDVTDSSNQRTNGNCSNGPSTSTNNQSPNQQVTSHDSQDISAPSMPVYSVINKSTRRSKGNIHVVNLKNINKRPPQPPPKNLPMPHFPSTSAIQTYQTNTKTNNQSGSRNSPQIQQTSPSSVSIDDNSSESKNKIEHATRLPQPPPRLSKQTMFDNTKRPLPLPDYDILNNNQANKSINNNKNNDNTSNNQTNSDRNAKAASSATGRDDDSESLNNGYELLNSNFDEDQIDVGYEKIKESHLYSGGSTSSQFNPLQLLDNGGYESVQPIYSSPSNALVEPNYEAIGPATASELTAAAAARLTAAATVMDFLKRD